MSTRFTLPIDHARQPASNGIMGYMTLHKIPVVVSAVVVMTIVVTVLTACTLSNTVREENPQNFILDDSSFVTVTNVAAILKLEETPALLEEIFELGKSDNLENSEERNEDSNQEIDLSRSVIEKYINLDNGTRVAIRQGNADGNGLDDFVAIGNYEFDVIRNDLIEEEFEEASKYRDFEVWDSRNVALLEDKEVIIVGKELVNKVLKALDTGKGSITAAKDDSGSEWGIKRVLDKVGKGLITYGFTDCTGYIINTYIVYSMRGCDAVAWAIKGGDSYTTKIEAVYVFDSERRVMSAMEDIEEAIQESSADVDLDKIEADREFVTVEITVHRDE